MARSALSALHTGPQFQNGCPGQRLPRRDGPEHRSRPRRFGVPARAPNYDPPGQAVSRATFLARLFPLGSGSWLLHGGHSLQRPQGPPSLILLASASARGDLHSCLQSQGVLGLAVQSLIHLLLQHIPSGPAESRLWTRHRTEPAPVGQTGIREMNSHHDTAVRRCSWRGKRVGAALQRAAELCRRSLRGGDRGSKLQ